MYEKEATDVIHNPAEQICLFSGHLFSYFEQQKSSKATYAANRYRAEAGRLARQMQYDRLWEDW